MDEELTSIGEVDGEAACWAGSRIYIFQGVGVLFLPAHVLFMQCVVDSRKLVGPWCFMGCT